MSDPFYRTPEWKQLRADCIARDPFCRAPGCDRPSSHADHIIPRSKGGPDHLGNLRGLCQSCHNRRTASGNGALRVPGCTVDGWPLDPNHAWRKR
ncbi:HNH endonuclease signature motif containing protein [Rhodospirillaceae bacterium SYSU D60014]|uniref:HNH endonuclease n=1 Tax=Virgifigura deserti TaxID=2268457 RepID=UPI000E67442F